MRRIIFPVWLIQLLLAASPASAHGVVGQRTFIEPMVAEDANPKNELVLAQPGWIRTSEGREFSLGFSLEKKLSDNTSLTLDSRWLALSPKARQEPYTTGFDNLNLLFKYAFLTLPEHELRLSAAAMLELPTGNQDAGAGTHTRIGPEALWAWGWGDIANHGILKYLRPFAIQGDVGYSTKTGGASNDAMFADNLIEYSIPYLADFVRDFGLAWPLRNLTLYTEFNYAQIVTGRLGTTFPAIRLTPGIAYLDRYLELSVATQFPLNAATVRDNHAAALGLIDLFLDDLIPATNWNPL